MYADAGPRTLIINLIMLLTQHRTPNIRPSDTQTLLVRVNQTNVGHKSAAQTVIFLSIHDTGNPDSNVLVLICVRNNPQCWYLVPITLDLE